ncbi:MAG TPA: hypothetical protein PKB06_13400 [Actinotalea sp.]|nr:hypothetical protein [Actinotalea sp.]
MSADAGRVPGVSPELERSARWWLRAYPPRWRGVQGAEVVTLVADLAPPGAARVPLGVGLGLLRAGWGWRWRHRPDPLAWFLYRFCDLPVTGYDPWVLDDIEGRWYTVRRGYLLWLLLSLQGSIVLGPGRGSSPWLTWGISVGVTVVFAVAMARPSRRYARRKHLGRPDPGPAGRTPRAA